MVQFGTAQLRSQDASANKASSHDRWSLCAGDMQHSLERQYRAVPYMCIACTAYEEGEYAAGDEDGVRDHEIQAHDEQRGRWVHVRPPPAVAREQHEAREDATHQEACSTPVARSGIEHPAHRCIVLYTVHSALKSCLVARSSRWAPRRTRPRRGPWPRCSQWTRGDRCCRPLRARANARSYLRVQCTKNIKLGEWI